MEKRVNSKIEQYIQTFKQDVCNKINELKFDNSSQQAELLGFIYDYDRLCMGKEDFVKRKRIKMPYQHQIVALQNVQMVSNALEEEKMTVNFAEPMKREDHMD